MYLTNLLQYLERTTEKNSDKIAFSDGKENLYFGDLLRETRAIGSFLLSKGIYRKPVMVFMNKQPHTVSAFLGVIGAGCFYVCVDPQMPKDRVLDIFNTVQPSAVICGDRFLDNALTLRVAAPIYTFDAAVSFPVNASALAHVREKSIDTDPIYVVFTSGSTGTPKGVVASHRSVIDYAESLCDALGFDEECVFASQSPFYYDAPLKEILTTLRCGATTYLIEPNSFMSPIKLCRMLEKYRVNTVCWVSSAFTTLAELGALDACPPKWLRTACFGSEPMSVDVLRQWQSACPNTEFVNLYGPTEATGMSCYYVCRRSLCDGEDVPIGKPFRNTRIILLDDDGKEVDAGREGEIYIAGSCVTLGYFGNNEITGERFVQNPINDKYKETVYRTGDFGRINSHGELVFTGRRDRRIKHMGYTVDLGEIEREAERCCGVIGSVVIWDASDRNIWLFYEGNAKEGELYTYLAKKLPRYALPSRVKHLEQLPRSANGKADRSAINRIAKTDN